MPYLPIIALICAALFTGAAGYINLVEHPARLELEDGPLLAQWQPSYSRALPIQSGLAIVGGGCGLAAWYPLIAVRMMRSSSAVQTMSFCSPFEIPAFILPLI